MKSLSTNLKSAGISVFILILSGFSSFSQTNVFDDIIATSPNHTYLRTALEQEGLDVALQNNAATLTVFAPTNAAFDDLAAALNTNIAGLLNLPNLSDVLLYHVLSTTVPSSAVTNGAIVTPLNNANTLKLTKTTTNSVFVNQAQVTTPDLSADNGVVHVTNAVLLPSETVVDVAIDNNFTYLTAAVVKAELLPALTNPFATFTVFAPTDSAFTNLATALNTTVNGLLLLPNLSDILKYHVLSTEATAASIVNGTIVSPLSTTNTLKLTKTTAGTVFVNHAQVTLPNVDAENGIVHVINKVVLPAETVVDVAIDNNFTSLTAAVVKAELVPALSNPLAEFTVFAPTNAAFDALAVALGTDLNGVLASPSLGSILLYHVVSGTVLSTDLTNGAVATLNGENITVDLSNGVKINNANVTTPDVEADNGVVHVIDAVLLPASLSVNEDVTSKNVNVYPNPSKEIITIDGILNGQFEIMDGKGSVIFGGSLVNGTIDVSALTTGIYYLRIKSSDGMYQNSFIRL